MSWRIPALASIASGLINLTYFVVLGGHWPHLLLACLSLALADFCAHHDRQERLQ